MAAERAWAEDVAWQRRRHKLRLGVLAVAGVGAVVAGAFAGGLAFVGGLAVLGGAVALCVRTGNPPNKLGEQAPQAPAPGMGPFTPPY